MSMRESIAGTKRLVIREIKTGDQDLIYNLARESPFWGNAPKRGEWEETFREVCWSEVNQPTTYNGMIFLRETGEFVGKVCMQHTDLELPELGIDIMRAHRNCGYGPEAITAFCDWYSETYELHKVKVRIQNENQHSIHVFEKLGAEYDRATTYLPQEVLAKIKKNLPQADLSELLKEDVRNYLLALPISSGASRREKRTELIGDECKEKK